MANLSPRRHNAFLTLGLTILFGMVLQLSNAQTFYYGTGSVSGNPAAGTATLTTSGNNVTVISTGTMLAGTYNFANFTVNAGVTVTVAGGTGPLVFYCTGTATINGTISWNGNNGTSQTTTSTGEAGGTSNGWGAAGGAGAAGGHNAITGTSGSSFGTSSGMGGGGTGSTVAGGGGGGGVYSTTNATMGATGTGGGAGGAIGTAYNSATLATSMTVSSITTNLLGGSGGGGGGNGANTTAANERGGGGGGSGGGAIQISAPTLTFGGLGLVTCNGGNGGTGSRSGTYPSGGGGGGSGGSIWLQYYSGNYTSANAQVNGGTGGTGGVSAGGAGGNGGLGVIYAQANCGPNAYNVTGGNGCSPVTVALSGSDTTATYQLVLNGTNLGSPVSGTGSAISFGPETAAGTYKVVATLGTSITMNDSVIVYANPTAPVISATIITCNGLTNGIVTITTQASGSTSPYTYSLNGAGYVAYSSTPYTGLNANNYAVTAKDANGCLSSASNSVTVSNPSAISVNASNTGPYATSQTISLSSTASGGTGTLTYSWSGPLSFSASGSTATRTNATTGMSGTYTVLVTDANECTATATTSVTVTGSSTSTWNGITSTDWFTAGNWTPSGVPNSCAAEVVIPSGASNAPTISGAEASVGNLSIASGVTLTLSGQNLSVCKNITGGSGSNAAVVGSGLVLMNGSISQTVGGNIQFNELELSNSQGASLTSNATVGISTALDLNTGNFDASPGSLTFLSTAVNQAGIIDNFSAGNSGTLTGSIYAQRYYATSLTYNQHFMGSPIDSPAKSQFGVSGTTGYVLPYVDCDETKLQPSSPYGTLFSYHENAPGASACAGAQWYVETSGDAQNGLGYSVLKSGNGTVTLNGTANLNTSYTLTGLANHNWSNTTLQGHLQNSGWQLLSNPYLASLQLNTVNTGFDAQIQVWHANGSFAGTYQPENIGSGSDTIPPFGAFLVHVTTQGASGLTYTINATERVRTPYTFAMQNDNQLDITVQNVVTGLLDKTEVAFNTNATDGFDPQFDADKFHGELNRHTLYTTLADGRWLARNVLNSINTTNTVPMGLEPGATGSYAMTFGNLNTFDPTTYIYLEDKQAGVIYNVRNGDYLFNADSTDNWNRFVLHFTPPVSINTTNATCVTTGMISAVQPGPANWNYTITNSSSAVIASGALNQSSPIHIGAAQGTYILNLVDNNYSVTKTIIVGGSPDIFAGFSVPGSASVQSPVNFISTAQNAVEYTWTFGDGSVITGVANPTYTYTLPGVYTVTLVVTDAGGCTSTTSQTITITGAAGIAGLGDNGAIRMWSNENLVYVDFTKLAKVDAVIKIYNILGQELSNEKFTNNSVYQKEIVNSAAAYIIVSVRNADETTTRKLFIINPK